MKKIYCFAASCGFCLVGWATNVDSLRQYDLEEISVSATRVNLETPVAFTDVSGEDIVEKNYGQDVPYLLQLTPSMVATSDAGGGVGYTDIRMRGYDGTRINVTTNGVPMNDAESHKMYWVDTPDLLSSVGSMQVQRGAGTSTNGSGAFGGSISMTTDNLPMDFGGSAEMSYGSFHVAIRVDVRQSSINGPFST